MPESTAVKLFLFHSLSKIIIIIVIIVIIIIMDIHVCIMCYLVSAALIKKEDKRWH